MGFVRNFKGITLLDGNLSVEGINAPGDDVAEIDVKELLVVLVARPNCDAFASAHAELPLTPGSWNVVFEDVSPPFDTPGDIIVMGMAKVYDEDDGGTYDVLWGGDAEITAA